MMTCILFGTKCKTMQDDARRVMYSSEKRSDSEGVNIFIKTLNNFFA